MPPSSHVQYEYRAMSVGGLLSLPSTPRNIVSRVLCSTAEIQTPRYPQLILGNCGSDCRIEADADTALCEKTPQTLAWHLTLPRWPRRLGLVTLTIQ
jgi:hypothetical protein